MSYPIGSRVRIRGEEWLVQGVQPTDTGKYAVRVIGLSETVRDYQATFLSSIDRIEQIRPEDVRFVADDSPNYRKSRLYLNALMMRTPVLGPQITTRGQAAIEDSDYQYVPAQKALNLVRPRILIADGVGLGKTIEAGILISELIRRGRGRRILIVSARSMLEQLQKELWTRFSIPLMRLDSLGIARIRRDLPQNKNPFHYYDKVIISIDTLKNDEKYRRFLENCFWDIVVIDECHNVANANTDRNRLATLLADRCHSLILMSATPHNGKAESFATLMKMLDPTSVADPKEITKEQIEHMVVRRFKKDVTAQTANFPKVDDQPVYCYATGQETEVLKEISQSLLHAIQSKKPKKDALFRVTLLKSFLSSPVALAETLEQRIKTIERQKEKNPSLEQDLEQLQSLLKKTKAIPFKESSKFRELVSLLKEWGWDGSAKSKRVIVFSERISTLEALKQALLEEFQLSEEVVQTFTAKMPDTEQQRVVREFNELESPIRLLLASDVASEGVNLHHLCHQLIHFDVPWSFIRLQQRNGRIDRFGQKETPMVRYLILKAKDTDSEVRVVEKLLEKAKSIEKSLGDPSSILRLYDAEKEEEYVQEQIAAGVEEDLWFTSSADDELDFDAFFNSLMQEDQTSQEISEQKLLRLYSDWLKLMEDLKEELLEYQRQQASNPFPSAQSNVKITIIPELQKVTISGIKDLGRRLGNLPPEARHKEDTIECTPDPKKVMKAITAATQDGKWPGEHLLWENHPIAEWVADRSLSFFGSLEAPVLQISGLSKGEVYYLVQAIALTESGHPALAEWIAVKRKGKGFEAQSLSQLVELLDESRWISMGDLQVEEVDPHLPEVVECAKAFAKQKLQEGLRELGERVKQEKNRLEEWKSHALLSIMRKKASVEQDPQKLRTLKRYENMEKQIQDTYDSTVKSLDSMVQVMGEPVLRVCARLEGSEG